MRSYNQTSTAAIRQATTLNRSRSQDHYYLQANQFEKRYQNSIINSYRLNSSRKNPPCGNTSEDRGYEGAVNLKSNEKENLKSDHNRNQYYETSRFNIQTDSETLFSLQQSKKYLEELVEKSTLNFRIHKEKTKSQIQTLQKLLQQKNTQIQQLTQQIAINPYNSRTKLNEENDMAIIKQIERQNQQLMLSNKALIQKIIWLQNEHQQIKQFNENTLSRNTQKLRTIQNQFLVLRQRRIEKDTEIQRLLSRIEGIQFELHFFKEKFADLLIEIQKQQSQAATILQHALFLKQQGLKFYEAASIVRQKWMASIDSQWRNSRPDGNKWFNEDENRLIESIAYVKGGFGQNSYSPTARKAQNYTTASRGDSEYKFIQQFPSLNMSISPISPRRFQE